MTTLSAKALGISEPVATRERVRATEQVLKNNLTLPETRELIKQVKAKYLKSEKIESKKVKAVIHLVRELSHESLATLWQVSFGGCVDAHFCCLPDQAKTL